MLTIKTSSSFRKSYKKISSKDKPELKKVLELLENDITLPAKYNNHPLSGNYKNCQECHIKPDLLLIYKKSKQELILYLIEIGSHSDLFAK